MNKNFEEFDSEAEDIDGENIIEESHSKNIVKESQNNSYIKTIIKVLTLILEENKTITDYKQIIIIQSKSIFSSHSIPKISLLNYLKRIQIYSQIETPTLICSLIYIDRLCNFTGIILTYYNIHRILFSAILMSIKFNEDRYYDNKYYSKIAGVKVKELKQIEYKFLDLIDFKLFISEDEFLKYKIFLENYRL